MDIADTISRIAAEMGISLEARNVRVYSGTGKSSSQDAEIFHDGQYYGCVALATDKSGAMEYCYYSGNHPALAGNKDWRKELGLHIERDEQGEFRVDSNPVQFLGWGIVDPKTETPEENSRRIPYIVGFSRAGIHMHNLGLVRQLSKSA